MRNAPFPETEIGYKCNLQMTVFVIKMKQEKELVQVKHMIILSSKPEWNNERHCQETRDGENIVQPGDP